jgi:hypothetical protein
MAKTSASEASHVELVLADYHEPWIAQILGAVLSDLHLASVQTLRLHAFNVVNHQAWEAFGASPNLRTLHPSGTTAQCVIFRIPSSSLLNLRVLDVSDAELTQEADMRRLEGTLLKWTNEGVRLEELCFPDVHHATTNNATYVSFNCECDDLIHENSIALAQR